MSVLRVCGGDLGGCESFSSMRKARLGMWMDVGRVRYMGNAPRDSVANADDEFVQCTAVHRHVSASCKP